jgi:hypothetical protein
MPARIEREILLITMLLAVPVTSALLLFSCGSRRAPQQLTVQVPDDFSGALRIRACQQGAALDKLDADAKGSAATSACFHKEEQVTLLIVRGSKTYRISPEDVMILRTGDGLATEIRAQVPPQP